jgi:CBS domain containing-hemolysin-like protein
MVTVGEDEGVLEEQEKEMIHSIFEFGDLVAREIMVPRVDISALDISSSVDDAVSLIVRTGHSRVPIYEETADRIKGILYAKDILRHAEDGDLDRITIADILRPSTMFVPETKDLSSLLEEMRAAKAHLAIVLDEYGGTAGIVTIEDILEEIVGDIQDEYDKPLERLVSREEDGSFVVDAKLGLHDFDDEIGVYLPEEDGVETVGGLLYQLLGRIPNVGETVPVIPVNQKHDGDYFNGKAEVKLVNLTVLEIEETRIGRVRVALDYENPESEQGQSEKESDGGDAP